MHMLYVCVLCVSDDSSQCCVLHDLQVVNAGRGLHECLFLGTPSCCSKCFYFLKMFLCVYSDVVNVCAVCECWV